MYKDHRGYLLFPIKDEKYINGKKNISKDCTYSVNHKNVFRGLHINSFGKLITCITGHFIDIMVNMETLKVYYYDIKPGDQIYCPANYGHGFISLEDNSVLSYHCEGYFGNEVGGLLNYKDPYLNIKLPVNDKDIIINEKDRTAPYLQFEYFMLGHNGFIGSHIYSELIKQGKKVLCLKERMEDIKSIKNKIEIYKPKYFINSAGLTGTPNISWCNIHTRETLMTNVINQINILNLCNEYSIHCTIIGSAAIFKSTNKPRFDNHKGDIVEHLSTSPEDGIGNKDGTIFTEYNYYGKCRILLEELIQPFNNCLYLRVNYPLSMKLTGPNSQKNLLNKLLLYDKIEDIYLSVTNLDSMCQFIPGMIENYETGVYNFVNNGRINMIDLYLKLVKKLNIDQEKYKKEYVNTKRESVIIVPKKMIDQNYFVQNITDSLN